MILVQGIIPASEKDLFARPGLIPEAGPCNTIMSFQFRGRTPRAGSPLIRTGKTCPSSLGQPVRAGIRLPLRLLSVFTGCSFFDAAGNRLTP